MRNILLRKDIRIFVLIACIIVVLSVSPEAIMADEADSVRGSHSREQLSTVGFSCMKTEPSDEEIPALVDDAIGQILGKKGLSAIIRKGDHVVIKVNLVGPQRGAFGEKGWGMDTDPRIVRYVADKVRDIIGFGDGADLKVIEGNFYRSRNPSLKSERTSFHYARIERTHDDNVDSGDYCYDYDGDGFLDGKSRAQLVNTDSIPADERFLTVVDEPILGKTRVLLPKFLRTRKQAGGEQDFCDVFIGIPIFKNHAFTGMTGAIKLHYGLHNLWGDGDNKGGRVNHAGYGWGTGDIRLLLDFLCALQKARGYDLVIMDCLTGNRRGPVNVYEPDINMKADIIRVNAVMCSRDPVAIDTVETLFAGYLPDSVPLLATAERDGLGNAMPGRISISGFDRFLVHKLYLKEQYGLNGGGRYPFERRWGKAAVHNDYSPPSELDVSAVRMSGSRYSFRCHAEERRGDDLGIARFELLVEGKLVAFSVGSAEDAVLEYDLKSFGKKKIRYQMAVWDKALNCSLSAVRELSRGR